MRGNNKKGVAVFIAVIAVSALLLIALAISDISYKEQIISSSGRDSRIAFYAADAGVECAFFHDLKGGADGLFKFSVPGAVQVGVLKCNGDDIITNIRGNDPVITTFYFNLSNLPKSCAIVQVSKETVAEGGFKTIIESRGYNNNCASGPTGPTIESGPRNLERSFEVTY